MIQPRNEPIHCETSDMTGPKPPEATPPPERSKALLVAAGVCGALGLLSSVKDSGIEVSIPALLSLLLGLIAVLLAVPNLLSEVILKFGGQEITVRMQNLEKLAARQSVAANQGAHFEGASKALSENAGATPSPPGFKLKEINNRDDPQKGRFCSQPERNGFRLSAQFKQRAEQTYAEIQLFVRAVEPRKSVTEAVTFYLHDTFAPYDVVTVQPVDGVATLSLLAWGGFTVGAVVHGKEATPLELDLAKLPEAPRSIRDN